MALFDINIDSVEDILSIRTAIITGNFVDGGGLVIVNYTSEGVTVSKQWAVSAATLLEETRNYLQEYDPDLYGRKIRRTSPSYLT
jgi:hypothetical protein